MYGTNGYGTNTGMIDEALNRLNNTKPVDVRDPFIGEGANTLLLVELIPFTHNTHGPSAKATFEVLQSQVHPPGTRVVKLWNLTKPSKWPSQPTDSDRFADFIRKMSGAPEGQQVGPVCAAVLRDRVSEQLLRGMVIKGVGVNTSKKADKPFIDVRWETVPQSQEQIRDWRAKLDAKAIPAPAAPAAYVTPPTAGAYAPPSYPAVTPVAAPAATPATAGSPLLSQIPGFNR